MARKKRAPEVPAPVSEPKERVVYQDAFQTKVGKAIEGASKTVEGKGKTLMYAIAAVAVLAVLVGIFYAWNRRSNAAAQTALGKAIEISSAEVTEAPQPGSTARTFRTEKERAEAAVNEFQAVAAKFGGDVGQKAKYFIAVNRLSLDRNAAISELEALSKSNDDVGKLSKFALAQAKAGDGKQDEALALYRELSATSDPLIPKESIDFEIAKILEKQGKTQEAVDLYFNIAKTASELKDIEGNPVPLSQSARSAKEKVQELNPEKAKEIPEPVAPSPLGF